MGYNGCCFPNNFLKKCYGKPGGGGRKYKMLWRTPHQRSTIGKYETEVDGETVEELEDVNEDDEETSMRKFVPILGGVTLIGSITVAMLVKKRLSQEASRAERELLATLE